MPMDIIPSNEVETLFSIVALILGLSMSAMVVSSATSALSNLDAAAESHRRELDAINGYLRFKRVPMDLRRLALTLHLTLTLTLTRTLTLTLTRTLTLTLTLTLTPAQPQPQP